MYNYASLCHLWFLFGTGYQLYLARMHLQLCAFFLLYPILTGSWTAAAAVVRSFVLSRSPHKIINILFAIVREDEAVHLHWKLVCYTQNH